MNFNSYIGLNVPHMMPLQSGEEYVQFRRDGYRYAHGWDTPFTDEDVFTQSELDMIKMAIIPTGRIYCIVML